jgi:hypothetical protein
MDPGRLRHMLGYITPNILPICLVIVAASAIFLALIYVEVVIGMFLIDLGDRNILDTNLLDLGMC